MSTKKQNKKKSKMCDEELRFFSVKQNRENLIKFKKRKSPRKTVQVRISKVWHSRIQKESRKKSKTMSLFLDGLFKNFFKHYK